MSTSFSTALSALNADSTAIDVTGNNLANLNTTGYKASEISFQDLVTQSMGAAGQTEVGLGIAQPLTLTNFSQGTLQTTAGPLDAAIQGQGFFMVNTSQGAAEYTRAGTFQVDQNGNLVTPTGDFVQGWTLTNGALNTNAPPSNIVIPSGSISAPSASQNFSFNMNLDASAAAGATFSTAVQVYDSLGVAHTLTATFTKGKTAGDWDYSISAPNSDVKSAFTPVTGSLTFDSNGNLTKPAATDASPQVQIQGLTDGAADMTLNWNLYSNGNPQITEFAQTSAVSGVTQDGSAAAQLVNVGITNGGAVVANYSNGQQRTVGQLAMALIRNPESLSAVGDNNYQATSNTAPPAIGLPNSGGRGQVVGGSLESSTADIATEFTNLIVFQRAYEANSKVITTADQLSQDTIALIH